MLGKLLGRFFKEEKGTLAAFSVLAFLSIVFLLAFAFDLGVLFLSRHSAQRCCDLATRSGAMLVSVTSSNNIINTVDKFLSLNCPYVTRQNLIIISSGPTKNLELFVNHNPSTLFFKDVNYSPYTTFTLHAKAKRLVLNSGKVIGVLDE